MKDLTLNELQQVYGGGFEEGRAAGKVVGKVIAGAFALYGVYAFCFL